MKDLLINLPPDQGKEYAVNTAQNILGQLVLENLPFYVADLPLIVEAPPQTEFDYGINLSAVASQNGYQPHNISSVLADSINSIDNNLIDQVEANGPFLNFKVDMAKYGSLVLQQVLEMGTDYGKENEGQGQRIVIDMSSPNIAKRMTYGHLRSTIIGDSVANLCKAQGYEVVRDNHLGDWGTQFGKQIVALKRWGDEDQIMASDDPVEELQDLYQKFHEEVDIEKDALREEVKKTIETNGIEAIPGLTAAIEKVSQEIMTRKNIQRSELDMSKVTEDALDRVIESNLEKEARGWFLKLEQGDPEARRLWELCVTLSIKEFNQIYDVLGVGFEETLGESFYEGMLKNVFDQVLESGVGKISDGALVIDMTDKKLGVPLVQKSDGASIYMTRDLACAIYRQNETGADKIIYVVGEDQKLYFQQLFEALRRLGYKVGENAEHVYFGMVSLKEGKMSTRKGRVVLLKDVINAATEKAETVLMSQEKNADLKDNPTLKETIIRQIAIGALKWNDLSQEAKKSIVYDLDKAIKLEGNSAPYVQYTAIRAKSILIASGVTIDPKPSEMFLKDAYSEPTERALIRQLAEYPNILREATKTSNPARVAAYVYELAKRFNSFYTNKKTRVLKAESQELVNARLKLVAASAQVITNALGILGIEVPERM